jgi:hypothetical protein
VPGDKVVALPSHDRIYIAPPPPVFGSMLIINPLYVCKSLMNIREILWINSKLPLQNQPLQWQECMRENQAATIIRGEVMKLINPTP